MCVIAVKKTKIGFIAGKNRDRNFESTVVPKIKNGAAYIEDTFSHWSEGVNSYGIGILSVAFDVNYDEEESKKIRDQVEENGEYISPEGKAIREALKLKTISEIIAYLVKSKFVGGTFVFSKNEAFLLESANRDNKYIYETRKIKDSEVLTNHGTLLTWAGYKKSKNKEENRKWMSSLERRRIVLEKIDEVETADDLLECLSQKPNDDPFLNPVRSGDVDEDEMVTTGQIVIVPKENRLIFRPIYGSIEGSESIEKSDLIFEIRKKLSIRESFNAFSKK